MGKIEEKLGENEGNGEKLGKIGRNWENSGKNVEKLGRNGEKFGKLGEIGEN